MKSFKDWNVGVNEFTQLCNLLKEGAERHRHKTHKAFSLHVYAGATKSVIVIPQGSRITPCSKVESSRGRIWEVEAETTNLVVHVSKRVTETEIEASVSKRKQRPSDTRPLSLFRSA